MNQIISHGFVYIGIFFQFLQKYTGNISLPTLHYSWLVILFFIFAVFLIGFSFGRSRMMVSLLSLYIAAFLESHFIYFDQASILFKKVPSYEVHIGLLLIIYVIVFAIINRSFLKYRLTMKEASVFSAVFLAVLEIGFAASLVMTYIPASVLTLFPHQLVVFFGTKTAQFWWAVVPVLVLVFLKKEKHSSLS